MVVLFLLLGLFFSQPSSAIPKDFISLSEIDPSILVEMRYFQEHNFVGARVDGYQGNLCYLTRAAAKALSLAQKEFLSKKHSLKVYDCYRPQRAVNHFARWSEDINDQKTREEFYPTLEKQNLFKLGYIAHRSGHSRGSTVDLTLVKLPAASQPPGDPKHQIPCLADHEFRYRDNSIDMGTGYDCFHPLSHTLHEAIRGKAKENRQWLKQTLEAKGFKNYEKEWWHFTYQPEPHPDTYFDFPVK